MPPPSRVGWHRHAQQGTASATGATATVVAKVACTTTSVTVMRAARRRRHTPANSISKTTRRVSSDGVRSHHFQEAMLSNARAKAAAFRPGRQKRRLDRVFRAWWAGPMQRRDSRAAPTSRDVRLQARAKAAAFRTGQRRPRRDFVFLGWRLRCRLRRASTWGRPSSVLRMEIGRGGLTRRAARCMSGQRRCVRISTVWCMSTFGELLVDVLCVGSACWHSDDD
mmetsp:Transcript_104008/g.333361  ORF Transcript_104008/g.333361 Transcript_104008/m.333361 type:complete len:224 (+) Transcript_104008:231-902(+)